MKRQRNDDNDVENIVRSRTDRVSTKSQQLYEYDEPSDSLAYHWRHRLPHDYYYSLQRAGMPKFMHQCFYSPRDDDGTVDSDAEDNKQYDNIVTDDDVVDISTNENNVTIESIHDERTVLSTDLNKDYPFDPRSDTSSYITGTSATMSNSYGHLTFSDTLTTDISKITILHSRNNGRLPAGRTLQFIHAHAKDCCSYDLLKLLSLVPTKNLFRNRFRGSDLADALDNILQKFIEESEPSLCCRTDNHNYCKYPSLFHKSVGRIWLLLCVDMFYHKTFHQSLVTIPHINLHEPMYQRNYVHDIESRMRYGTKAVYLISLARISYDFFRQSFTAELQFHDFMTELFCELMDKDLVVLAVPFSLFAPKRIVFERCRIMLSYCDRKTIDDQPFRYILQTALKYMMYVRYYDDDHVNDICKNDNDARTFLYQDYRRFDTEAFVEPSKLQLLALRSIVKNNGLSYALRYMCLELPWDILAPLHRYFYYVTWRFVRSCSCDW